MMEDKELELRKIVEATAKVCFRIYWDKDTVLTAFTEFEKPEEGLEKTLEYWEEFLKSEEYESYWKSYRFKGKFFGWEYHLDEVEQLFRIYIRKKITGED